MRLIDADSLFKTIEQNDYLVRSTENSIDRGMFTTGIEQAIDEQPTVDAVKNGYWIKCAANVMPPYNAYYTENPTYLACSECGGRLGIFQNSTNFCPHCGAKMDKEDIKNETN